MRLEEKREKLGEFLKGWKRLWEAVFPYLSLSYPDRPLPATEEEERYLRLKGEILQAFPWIEAHFWEPELVESFRKAMTIASSLRELVENPGGRELFRKHWGIVDNGLNLTFGRLEQEAEVTRRFSVRLQRWLYKAFPPLLRFILFLVIFLLALWKVMELVTPWLLEKNFLLSG